MFVDASAIVAILTREAHADEFANALDTARSPITSAIAVFEATLGVCRKRHSSVAEAQADVSEFLGTAGVRTIPITSKEAEAALDAFSRYGKGRVIQRSSIWEIALPMQQQNLTGQSYCSKATTSTRPTLQRRCKRVICNLRGTGKVACRAGWCSGWGCEPRGDRSRDRRLMSKRLRPRPTRGKASRPSARSASRIGRRSSAA